jgi:hypothetical protein
MITIAYQIPATLVPLSNSGTDIWSKDFRPFFGLYRYSHTTNEPDDVLVTNSSMALAVLCFFALLIQRRINRSRSLYFVVRHIKKDAENAFSRAREYHDRRIKNIRDVKEKYDQ